MLTSTASLVVALSFGGFLSDPAPRSARLLEDGALAVAASEVPPMPAGEPLETPEALRQRIFELHDSRPSLGGPIALLITGGVLALVGVGFLLDAAFLAVAAATTGIGQVGTFFLIAGIVGVGVGVALLITGAVLLGVARAKRRDQSRELDELNFRLRRLEAGGQHSGLPPSERGLQAEPAILLASF